MLSVYVRERESARERLGSSTISCQCLSSVITFCSLFEKKSKILHLATTFTFTLLSVSFMLIRTKINNKVKSVKTKQCCESEISKIILLFSCQDRLLFLVIEKQGKERQFKHKKHCCSCTHFYIYSSW